MKTPRPSTVWVMLWNDRLSKPTRHYYVKTEELVQKDDFDIDGRWQVTFGFIYRCAETGDPRLYGAEAVRLRTRTIPIREEVAS